MRVISGLAKGKRLITPEDNKVRPTTDRVKEAIFSAIQFEIEGKVFLDLFAGSGQMGIEALSRGASAAIFLDNKLDAIKLIYSNLSITRFEEKSEVVFNDSLSFFENNSRNFEIVFLDPPYGLGIIKEILPVLARKIADNGIIICEHSVKEILPERCFDFCKARVYRYGKIAVTIYKKFDGP
jgi:16S rRNA (guanine(966)-N(2))-methyltransferase RsmD